jgi:TRAP-type C4-dicarboxylate transport system permease small subunit
MKKVLSALTKAENIIMLVTFSVMVICEFMQVVNRNFIKLPITWYDELAEYCMIYMVLMGTEIGLRDGTQIAVTGVVDKLDGKKQTVVKVLSRAVIVVFSFLAFMGSLELMNIQIRTGQVSAALGIPMAVPYFAMVLSFGIITLVQGLECIHYIAELFKSDKGGKAA